MPRLLQDRCQLGEEGHVGGQPPHLVELVGAPATGARRARWAPASPSTSSAVTTSRVSPGAIGSTPASRPVTRTRQPSSSRDLAHAPPSASGSPGSHLPPGSSQPPAASGRGGPPRGEHPPPVAPGRAIATPTTRTVLDGGAPSSRSAVGPGQTQGVNVLREEESWAGTPVHLVRRPRPRRGHRRARRGDTVAGSASTGSSPTSTGPPARSFDTGSAATWALPLGRRGQRSPRWWPQGITSSADAGPRTRSTPAAAARDHVVLEEDRRGGQGLPDHASSTSPTPAGSATGTCCWSPSGSTTTAGRSCGRSTRTPAGSSGTAPTCTSPRTTKGIHTFHVDDIVAVPDRPAGAAGPLPATGSAASATATCSRSVRAPGAPRRASSRCATRSCP